MKVVIVEGRLGWYWRLVARNGRVLAIGAEPFSSKTAGVDGLDRDAELVCDLAIFLADRQADGNELFTLREHEDLPLRRRAMLGALHVLKKLGLRNNVELARHALRVGWVSNDNVVIDELAQRREDARTGVTLEAFRTRCVEYQRDYQVRVEQLIELAVSAGIPKQAAVETYLAAVAEAIR